MEGEETAAKRLRAEDVEVTVEEVRAEEVVANNGISAVMPGWFSEISPMWPGTSH